MPFAKERNRQKVSCVFPLRRISNKQYNIFIIIINISIVIIAVVIIAVIVIFSIVIIIIMVLFIISSFVIIIKCFIFLSLENYGDEIPSNLSLMQHGFHKLNRYQETAVREALSKPFTLIQGPPGTSCV